MDGLDFGCRGTFCFVGLVLIVLTDHFYGDFVHERIINALSTAIGGTYFDYTRTGLIGLSLNIGIFVSCTDFFYFRILEVIRLILALLVSFSKNMTTATIL